MDTTLAFDNTGTGWLVETVPPQDSTVGGLQPCVERPAWESAPPCGVVLDRFGKRELSWKTKLLIYHSIYILTLTYCYEVWVVTERIRSRIQATKNKFPL